MENPTNKTVVTVFTIALAFLFQLYIIIKQHQMIVDLRLKPIEIVQYTPHQECPSEDEVIAKVTTGSMLKYFLKDVE